ncbi:hypothetical protein HJB79_30465 [Rhizobium lentis]|uniref:hypothetical protein n=1 Tax=Rhizobium lentis TaxID=1138194 RepID=UPI001C835AFF|nr:hypothetical protein [Rhizobium lentis]MBX5135375.1 hypothetical protein [Rhizobium lentis]MBX5143039.1 hypothetical protein [Rhizobium lentis]MBX5180612.1 hypothetical protein [Rhizobium lentis]
MIELGHSGLSIAPLIRGGNVLGWTSTNGRVFRLLDAFVDHGFAALRLTAEDLTQLAA